MPGPVSVSEMEKWPFRAPDGDADFAGVGELDGLAHEVEQHLREALFVSEANRERLVHGRRQRELLVLGQRLGGRAHGAASSAWPRPGLKAPTRCARARLFA